MGVSRDPTSPTPHLTPHIPIEQVQADLVRMGALKMLLERAGTGGADNSDIRSLALQTLQHVASHGANMAALRQPEVINRLKGLATVLASDAVVVRSVSAILRSIETISTLPALHALALALTSLFGSSRSSRAARPPLSLSPRSQKTH